MGGSATRVAGAVVPVGAERRVHLGAADRSVGDRGMVRHGQHRQRACRFRRTGGDPPQQAAVADELALLGNLRLVHRLGGGLPMLVNTQFPAVDAFSFAFVGPLLGALVRPIGGWLADRVAGARITVGVFVVMMIAPLAAAFFLPAAGAGGSLMGFVLAFIALFVAAGVGNGSTFRMIPIIFRTLREREVKDPSDKDALEEARRVGATEGAATLGFSSAVAAIGLAFIPIAYGTSINLTGSPSLR